MDVDVRTSREIEMEIRFRRVQSGALETVQSNGELLKVSATRIPQKRLLTDDLIEISRFERRVEYE
jgi:hypothetical protein